MTLSTVSNTGLPKTNISQQKTGANADQIDKKKQSLSSGDNPASQQLDEVTLNQAEKTSSTAREIDSAQAQELLPKTIQSILANSKSAISAQANTSAETAKEMLS